MNKSRRSALLLCLCWLGGTGLAEAMVLTSERETEIPIRIPEDADARVAEAASDLSARLEKMFGKPFPIESAKGETGIILGTLEDHPQFQAKWEAGIPETKEGYVIKSDTQRVLLIGASSRGIQNAVWDFLHRLGYRHYFPGSTWEIIPSLDRIDLELDEVSSPSFFTRTITIGHSTWPELRQEYQTWLRHNRLDAAFRLSSGHAYSYIIKRNELAFQQNSHYLVNPPGTGNSKFVIAEPGLRKLVLEDSLARLRADPDLDSISLEPSDGGGWPESSALGSVSDQVVTLANEVAQALQTEKPGVKVGIYAYNEHSPAPSIDVHPDVIVSVATGFIRGGHTFEELMAGWAARGATLGVRDYLGVWAWDNDLPGKPAASSPEAVAEKLALFYRLGARYYVAEANYGFAPSGLGLYTASRCLWDIGELRKVSSIRKDFFQKAFGPASKPMEQFYRMIDAQSSPLLSEHLLGSMYRALQEAYGRAGADAGIIGRIGDLAAYTRFVELYREYLNAEGSARQQAFEAVAAYAKSIRMSGMVHTWGMLRDQPTRDRNIKVSHLSKDFLSDIQSYSAPTHAQLKNWVAEGIARNDLLPFAPKSFSENLVPLHKENQNGAPGTQSIRLRGNNSLFVYVLDKGPITFSVRGGMIYGNRGPVKIRLFPLLEAFGKPVADIEVPADKTEHEVSLETGYEGLHRIEIKDGNDQTILRRFKGGMPLVLPSRLEDAATISGRNNLYFFVPLGTKSVSGYSGNKHGDVIAPDGTRIFRFSQMGAPGYFQIPVPKGQDGKVWMLNHNLGKKILMTVPPYFALEPQAMLVPKEVLP